jgi:hypothetical protein
VTAPFTQGSLGAAAPAHLSYCSDKRSFIDYCRRIEPGGPNGVTIITAAKARNCQRALDAHKRSFIVLSGGFTFFRGYGMIALKGD